MNRRQSFTQNLSVAIICGLSRAPKAVDKMI
jgi:hypothetical protein